MQTLQKCATRTLQTLRSHQSTLIHFFRQAQPSTILPSLLLFSSVTIFLLTLKRTTLFPTVVALEHHAKSELRERFNFIDKVVKQCASAVVYIEIKDPRKIDPGTGGALVTSNGSGFIVAENGWILTNAHVVVSKPQSVITVMMSDGTTYQASLEEVDMNLDLALIRIYAGERLPYLNFAEDNDAAVGEWVVAMGSPLCLSHSISVGVVSSVNRTAEALGLRNYTMKYIQTDAAITFGNSGGPLVNLDGNVIGINNLRITSGIAFAIPVEYAKQFLEQTKFSPNYQERETLDVNCLGIATFPMTPYLTRELLLQKKIIPEGVDQGVLVWRVLKGTPAHTGGLEPGDIITHVDGVPVKEASDIYILHSKKNGRVLKMEVIRDGRKTTVSVRSTK